MKLLGTWLTLVVLLLPGMWAQDAAALFGKAPPEVDEALRTTASAFFDLQVSKKYGSSVKYVAEESLDAYIGSEKDSCFSIEIMGISYNDAFNDAIVTILCERGMATPVGGGRVTMPTTTYWRTVDGEWKWYTPKDPNRPAGTEYVMTPFGPVPSRTPDVEEGAKPKRGDVNLTSQISMEQIKAALQTNPKRVILRADAPSSASAEVFNSFPGLLKVAIRWVGLKGLTAHIDAEELQANGKAKVSISYEPQGILPPPKIHAVWVETSPMRSATPIVIEFRFEEEFDAAPENAKADGQ